MAVRAVLWDADGVLQDLPGFDVVWGFLEVAQREALHSAVFRDMPEVLAGRVDMAGRVDRVIAELGLEGHRVAIEESWRSFPPVAESRDLIPVLRGMGVRCVLASNQDSLREQHMRPVYEPLLDGLYFSSSIGLAKPDPAYFTAIATDLDLPPGDLLFVDDNRDNVAGALSAGLRAEWWHHAESPETLVEVLARHGLEVG